MPHTRKDYFDDGSYDTASDSDAGRVQKDQQIRQAPYVPRIQIWARDDGPYTLRIGNQWFHCDDLVINGGEYRQKARPASGRQPSTPGVGNHAVYPPSKSRRPLADRAQSYQRTRPDKSSTGNNISSNEQNARRLAPQSQYQPQSLPHPKEQAERRRVDRRQQKDTEPQQQVHPQNDRSRRDSGVSVGNDSENPSGALVRWQPQPEPQPLPRPNLERRPSKQARPMRPRPDRLARGSSYDRPVRSKGKKQVRFAAVT